MVGVLGVSASAILVRFSQAPSVVTAAYRLGWTVLLLLPVVLLRCRAELRRVTARDLVLLLFIIGYIFFKGLPSPTSL